MSQNPPLDGLRVIEIGSIYAGPYCCQLLGDMGAEVIKIERPGLPDPLRSWAHTDERGVSYHWSVVSRNKHCVTLDVKTVEGRELFLELVAQADVLVENFRPGTMEKWQLGPSDLEKINPRLIYARVSGYGQTGPYAARPGFGLIGEAMSGLRSITGEPGRPPIRAGVSIADAVAGMFTAYGVLACLHELKSSGKGQVVDTALYESLYALMKDFTAMWEADGIVKPPVGTRIPRVVPTGIYTTAEESYVVIGGGTTAVFARLATAMGRPELSQRFPTPALRADNEEEIEAAIEAWVATQTAEAVLNVLEEAGVPASKVYGPQDILADPQYQARDMLLPVEWPGKGVLHFPGVVPKLSRTPGRVTSTLPEMGESNKYVFSELLNRTADELVTYGEKGII
ncbi:CaiB/BaiF CoA transferase family protein [Arthrobacter nitrophenolicus]|uniref:CoA transferase n=1 Tax=Arthrobacter nitrophenolicus TaxID=683150 RepID=A0A4R5Y598_9MICC|nr:CoA transferase [Arthrobacter nitrophenolicus]TDL39673.1 CoA transferase [Arthrobacter nitrophenolicus]